MKDLSYFTYLYRSFYDTKLYQDVVHKWKGIKASFLLFLVAVILVPSFIVGYVEFRTWYKQDGENFINQIPKVTITNGEVSTDVKEPYPLLLADEEEEFLIMIDTTGKYMSLDDLPAHILLTKNKLFMRKDDIQVREYNLSEMTETVEFSAVDIREIVKAITTWGMPLIFLCAVLLIFVVELIFIYIISVLSFALTAILKCKWDFSTRMRASIIAFTPVAIIQTILGVIGYPTLIGFWAETGLVLILLAFIMIKTKKGKK